jgi:hypothetical protein
MEPSAPNRPPHGPSITARARIVDDPARWRGGFFDRAPHRIFLDTNAVSYLLEHGEFVFEGVREDEDALYLPAIGQTLHRGDRLFDDLEALNLIFAVAARGNMVFAVSEHVAAELDRAPEPDSSRLLGWFFDILDHWQTAISEDPPGATAAARHAALLTDKRLLHNIQAKDRPIIEEAVRLDCDALLTTDRFASPDNQRYFESKYGILLLWPSDLAKILLAHVRAGGF